MGSIWLFSPNSSRQKEIIGSRLKSYCSARNRFILTLPVGFSIRGLVKQTGVTLLYIEVFHCCSCKKGNRDFRDLAGSPAAWSHFLLSHKSVSSTYTEELPLEIPESAVLHRHLQFAACANSFNLAQGHVTKPFMTFGRNSYARVDINTEYFQSNLLRYLHRT